MDIKIRNEIIRLKKMRDFHENAYLIDLQLMEEKMVRIEEQINRSSSNVKNAILEKQKQLYEDEIIKIDKNIEHVTNFINKKIESLEKQLNNHENEKHSLVYNIDKLKEMIARRNINDIFEMFEHVTNALTIINDGSSNNQP